MTPHEITTILSKCNAKIAEHPVPLRSAFFAEMKDKSYGEGALLQAWLFYAAGWYACGKVVTEIIRNT